MPKTSTSSALPATDAQRERARQIAWFGAVEAGWKGPECTSLPLRLECLRVLAGLTQAGWATASECSKETVSAYLLGTRGTQDSDKNRPTVLALLQATMQNPTDLAWVLGWQTTGELKTITDRAELTTSLLIGDGSASARRDEYLQEYPALFDAQETAQPLIQQQAAALAKRAGGWASEQWLLTGVATPPPAILAAADFLRNIKIDYALWDDPSSPQKPKRSLKSTPKPMRGRKITKPTREVTIGLNLTLDQAMALLGIITQSKAGALVAAVTAAKQGVLMQLLYYGADPAQVSRAAGVRDDAQVREILMPRILDEIKVPARKQAVWMRILGLPTVKSARSRGDKRSSPR